jgi:hypothetical protein
MAKICNKADIGLADARHIENREIFGALEDRAKLLKSAAVARNRRRLVLRCGLGMRSLAVTESHGKEEGRRRETEDIAGRGDPSDEAPPLGSYLSDPAVAAALLVLGVAATGTVEG